ncbi:Putative nudix hydrolase 7 [Toxocara canis]|uniref:Putative nudix hydrolase 7 n=1 Tax=Toxocara canis TaxID=6265 RepID=A0A0B2VKA6_TOXCA|nr:Putative nudix hydrolase 7 [Toxocara canis]
MGRRSACCSFLSNAVVFPGGVVEPNDGGVPVSLTNLRNLTAKPIDFARRIAALRELFEESALLPVVDENNNKFLLSTALDARVHEWHSAVHKGQCSLVDVMLTKMKHFRLDNDSLKPLSNWLTPFDYAKRFDTFFYTMYVDQCVPTHSYSQEFEKMCWIRPAEILERAYEGKVMLPPPQAYELTRLLRHRLAHIHTLHTDIKICPQLLDAGDEVIALLNGDHAYEEGENSTKTPMRLVRDADVQHNGVRIHRAVFRKTPPWSNMKIYSSQ